MASAEDEGESAFQEAQDPADDIISIDDIFDQLKYSLQGKKNKMENFLEENRHKDHCPRCYCYVHWRRNLDKILKTHDKGDERLS